MPAHEACIRAATELAQGRRGLPSIDACLVRVVKTPRDGVEDAGDAVLCDAAAEQRVALEGAEGVVLDFGVGGRGALADEVEVDVGFGDGRVEQDQPNVDAEFGLEGESVSN